MKNLNEEINRIKTLMLINEQCGGDLPQCEADLEADGYKVLSPAELESDCGSVDNIKNIAKIFSKKINASNPIDISNVVINSTQGSDDCFILLKDKHIKYGSPVYHVTFYNDNQVIITKNLNAKMGHKEILYSGKYDTDGSKLEIGKLRYKGVYTNGSTNMEDFDVLTDSGMKITISSADAGTLSIDEGHLKIKDVLTYNLHQLGYDKNVLKSDFDGKTAITKILT